MPYVVTDACIRCRFMDCIDVCPVDCFRAGREMLVISPLECIHCGACEPECPAEAILPDTAPEAVEWIDHNRLYAERWPVAVNRFDPPEDAERWIGVTGKFSAFFVSDPDSRGG